MNQVEISKDLTPMAPAFFQYLNATVNSEINGKIKKLVKDLEVSAKKSKRIAVGKDEERKSEESDEILESVESEEYEPHA